MSNEADLLAAARRRAAGYVKAWRQECPARPYSRPNEEFECWPTCKVCGATGWVPGVKAADGSTREIHLEDVLAAVGMSESDGAQITAGNHYVVMAGAAFYEPSPGLLLLAALKAFSAAKDANHDTN